MAIVLLHVLLAVSQAPIAAEGQAPPVGGDHATAVAEVPQPVAVEGLRAVDPNTIEVIELVDGVEEVKSYDIAYLVAPTRNYTVAGTIALTGLVKGVVLQMSRLASGDATFVRKSDGIDLCREAVRRGIGMYSGADETIVAMAAEAEAAERGLWYNLPLKFRLTALGALTSMNLPDAARALADWAAFSPDDPDATGQLALFQKIHWIDNDPDFYRRAALRRAERAEQEAERAAAEAQEAQKHRQAYLREAQNVMGWVGDAKIYTDAKTGEQSVVSTKEVPVYSDETRAKMNQHFDQARHHANVANQLSAASAADAAAAARAHEIAIDGRPRFEFSSPEDKERYTDLVLAATAAAIRATRVE